METKKPSKSGQCFAKLTNIESEVLRYLTEDFLTPQKIAIRRGVSERAIYYTINNLKKKGVLNKAYENLHKLEPTSEVFGRFRLHALELNIRLLFISEFYRKLRGKVNHIIVDGNTVRLYGNSIEVYVAKSFWGDSVQKATSRSNLYVNRLLTRLESEFKIIIVKDRSQNIKVVNAHYSEVNNGLAKDCNINKDKIKVYSNEGKLWFLIDNSFNLDEAETVHPQRSKQDMEKVIVPFFNDLRNNSPPTLSQVMFLIKEVVNTNKETAAGLNIISELLRSQVEPIKEEKIIQDKSLFDYVG